MQVFTSGKAASAKLGHCAATIGKYDGMHLGHQSILSRLKKVAIEAGLPSVVVLSEPQPEEYFSGSAAPARLNHFEDKVDFLQAFGIDAVVRLEFDHTVSQTTAESFVHEFLHRELQIRQLVVGDDFRFGRQRSGDIALLQELGNRLGFQVQGVHGLSHDAERVSSTLVRKYLQAGNCRRVRELLGRFYSIGGRIVHGQKLGRKLGVPTANLALPGPSLPMTGVFVVKTVIAGQQLPGVASIGYRPSVSDGREPTLEVHLLDFSGDLYGEHMRVNFLHRIRDEEKLQSLEALRCRMEEDISAARDFFARQQSATDTAIAR